MLDKETILREGLLERYILGELEASVMLEVEAIIQEDAELKAQFQDMEQSFENLGLENAVLPPKELKSSILFSIEKAAKKPTELQAKEKSYKLWFSLAAAAAVILFFNSVFLIVQNGNIKQELLSIKTETEQLKKTQESIEKAYNNQQMLLAFLSDPGTERYALVGNDQMPNTRLVSYINHQDRSVMVNTTQLATLDNELDYQMWADVDGEMINMGVIDKSQPLIAMNYIEEASSLNITIEPKGGSEHPTVSNLISNVYLQ
jgi:anti-sigma-K factor RskA